MKTNYKIDNDVTEVGHLTRKYAQLEFRVKSLENAEPSTYELATEIANLQYELSQIRSRVKSRYSPESSNLAYHAMALTALLFSVVFLGVTAYVNLRSEVLNTQGRTDYLAEKTDWQGKEIIRQRQAYPIHLK
jgi:hypothetical protein